VKQIGQIVRLANVSRVLPVLLFLACQGFTQPPKIGEINFYGLRKLPPDSILAALGIKSGDPLPPSKGALEDRLGEVAGIVDGRIEAVCCDGSKATLFIGVEERGGPHFNTHSAPAGGAVLPDEIINQYHELLTAVARAARDGKAGEDLSAGHSLIADPDARKIQEGFIAYAADNMPLIREVLRDGSEPEQRATAAVVIGYAPKKNVILNDLQYALQDPDDSVRGNAARSLKAIAVMALKQPQAGVKVSPVWFIEMLNSVALSDRIEAARTLVILTDQPNPPTLDLLRERAVPALTEMARWKTLEYALPAFLLLGRVASMKEDEIQDQWSKGDRELVIRKASQPPAPRNRR